MTGESVEQAAPETIVAMYDLPGASVKIGWLSRVPLFLVVHNTGRVAVVYSVEPGIVIELRSTS